MPRQRITPVGVLLAAVLAMGVGIASGREAVNIAIPVSVGISSSTDLITITGAVNGTRDFTTSCMSNVGFGSGHEDVKVEVLDRAATPAATIIRSAYWSVSVRPGTRLIDLSLVGNCTDGGDTFNIYQGTIASPRRLNVAFVTTLAGITLADDHEAITGKGTDELGIANAVYVKKGQKVIETEIISDIPLEPGDRLTDFVELDFNPATGDTLYGAWLEY